MYRILRLSVIFAVSTILLFSGRIEGKCETNEYVIPEATVEMITYIPEAKVSMVKEEPKKKTKKESSMSKKDKELLALVTMAEAEGECEKGKRLVIDTILNRVDSKRFPNTIKEVVYQKSQFTSMWNGRVDRCYIKKDIYQLVEEELESRTNSEVLFFTAGRYGDYGTPMFSVGNHYFSK